MPPGPSILAKTLLNAAAVAGTRSSIDMGQMTTNQSIQTFPSVPSASFMVTIEGSMDNSHWFPFGYVTGPGIKSEAQHTFQFMRATLDNVSEGSVTIYVSYNTAKQ